MISGNQPIVRRSTLAVLIVAALVLARPAEATTYNVSTMADLQAAVASVNAGSGGDTIVLAPGFYDLTSVGLDRLSLNRDVTIQGDPSSSSVLDGGGSIDDIFSINANNVTLTNLTLQNARYGIDYEGEGMLSLTGVTVTGMRHGLYADSGGVANITNSTFANNVINPGNGIEVACATLHLTNVTSANNTAGVYFDFPCGEQMQVTNSLIVGNGDGLNDGNGQDCGGGGSFVKAGGASLDTDGTCSAFGFPGFTTVELGAIGLGSLSSNGGPTMTEAISGSGPAGNTGDNSVCPATDQRGSPRSDGYCDIGAYEATGNGPYWRPFFIDVGGGVVNNTTPVSTVKAITYTNVDSVDITVNNVTVVGDDVASEFALDANPGTCIGQTIAAGATCTVNVDFTPTVRGIRTGTVHFDATDVNTNPASQNLTVQGHGTFWSPYTLNVGSSPLLVRSAEKTFNLTYGSDTQESVDFFEVTGPFATGATDTCTGNTFLSPGTTSCSLSLTYTPTAVGAQYGTLRFHYSDNTTDDLLLKGTGTQALKVTSVSFPKVVAHTASATRTATIWNPTGFNRNSFVTIGTITIDGTNAADFASAGTGTCAPGTQLYGGDSCTYDLIFTPGAAGARTGGLTVTSDAATSSSTGRLTGTGTVPLTVSPTSLGFGNVPIGTTSATLRVTASNANVSDTITLASGSTLSFPLHFVISAATCTPGLVLNPGDSCTVDVAFQPSATGRVTGPLTIASGATNSPNTVSLSGTGTDILKSTPSSLNFGNVAEGTQSAAKTVTLTNPTGDDIPLTSVGADNADFGVTNNCGASVPALSSCTISVTLTPSAQGSRTGTLTINSGASNNIITVALSGTGTLMLTMSASTLNFGNVLFPGSASRTLTLKNANQSVAISLTEAEIFGGNDAFFITSNTCGSDGSNAYDNLGGSVPAGGTCSFIVTFSPTGHGPGTNSATLKITSNASNNPTVSVNLAGSYQ